MLASIDNALNFFQSDGAMGRGLYRAIEVYHIYVTSGTLLGSKHFETHL